MKYAHRGVLDVFIYMFVALLHYLQCHVRNVNGASLQGLSQLIKLKDENSKLDSRRF
jgi:hypothetical protein